MRVNFEVEPIERRWYDRDTQGIPMLSVVSFGLTFLLLFPTGDKKNCQVGARHQEDGEAGRKRWKAGNWGWSG